MTEICFDPVADGKPSRDRILWAGAVLLGGIALFEAYHGDYDTALQAGSIAVWMLITDRAARAYWWRGYHDAVRSATEQMVQERDE